MSWSDHDPGQGNPAAIDGLAKLRRVRAGKIRDAQHALRTAASASGAQWQAMSQTAFASKLTTHAADIELLATGLEAQATALQTYAGQLSQLQDRQRVLEQQRSRARMDLGMAQLRLQSAGAALPSLLRSDTPDAAAVDDARRKTAAATSAVADAESATRAIDAQWDQLITDRRAVDATCASALQSERVFGQLAGVSNTSVRASAPAALLALLGTLTSTDLRILAARTPGLSEALEHAPPSEVASWWDSLPATQRTALVTGLPTAIGALDGLPALARVAANKLNAKARLDVVNHQIEHWRKLASDAGAPHRFDDRLRELGAERQYLRRATGEHPAVQLYLYDHAQNRIVEMIGTPSARTRKVLTYVPGTFADMQGFYGGSTQRVARYLQQVGGADTVAFVYKDGPFPQSIAEANEERRGLAAGRRLASFEEGVVVQPQLRAAQQVGIGHSWGLANVAAAEVAGAHFDKVISLSGAGVPTQWQKNPASLYVDFSYDDILQDAQHLPGGHVWGGRSPRTSGFDHGEYYVAPDSTENLPLNGVLDSAMNGLALHNLIASTSADNRLALRDIVRFVEDRER